MNIVEKAIKHADRAEYEGAGYTLKIEYAVGAQWFSVNLAYLEHDEDYVVLRAGSGNFQIIPIKNIVTVEIDW